MRNLIIVLRYTDPHDTGAKWKLRDHLIQLFVDSSGIGNRGTCSGASRSTFITSAAATSLLHIGVSGNIFVQEISLLLKKQLKATDLVELNA